MKLMYNLIFVFFLIFHCNFLSAQSKLHNAAGKNDLETVQTIVEKGTNVDRKDIAGQTPMMWAAETGSIDVVKYLVEKGADVNAVAGKQGRGTALIYAAATNRTEVVNYLLDNGADIDAVTPYQKESALFWAAAMGHKEVVQLLLEKGANKTLVNRSGQTVIDVAKQLNREEIIQMLEAE